MPAIKPVSILSARQYKTRSATPRVERPAWSDPAWSGSRGAARVERLAWSGSRGAPTHMPDAFNAVVTLPTVESTMLTIASNVFLIGWSKLYSATHSGGA